ncbi:unnamed protein product [Caenorhabditis nigoni]
MGYLLGTIKSFEWRSPTICAETLAHDRLLAAKKRVSIVPDPPSMDVSVNMASMDQMKDEHHHNLMREEELLGFESGRRKQSEEEVRKLSDERKRVIYERRRSSTSENPNGVPIMQAFQKAYQEVRAGRRRSTIHDNGHPLQKDTADDLELSPEQQWIIITILLFSILI